MTVCLWIRSIRWSVLSPLFELGRSVVRYVKDEATALVRVLEVHLETERNPKDEEIPEQEQLRTESQGTHYGWKDTPET